MTNTRHTVRYRGHGIDPVYSPHDGGHYAEVYDRLWKEVHVTAIGNNTGEVVQWAKDWIDANTPQGSN